VTREWVSSRRLFIADNRRQSRLLSFCRLGRLVQNIAMSFVSTAAHGDPTLQIAALPNGQRIAYRILGTRYLACASDDSSQPAASISRSTSGPALRGSTGSQEKALGRVVGQSRRNSRPLVLVTGFTSVGTVDWSPLAERLADERPVLIFDNRGIGSSVLPKGKERFSVTDMADDTILLVKHLGWSVIDLLGYSMGGLIVQTVLCRDPQSLPFQVKHLVLAATMT
jgi:pimeloyl-ACP methyl ester carboxylesterase